MHCNEEDKQSTPTTIQDAIKRYILQLYTLQQYQPHRRNNTFQYGRVEHRGKTTPNYFNMDNLQTERAIICPISHYKETSRTTTTNRIKCAHAANKTLLLQLYTLQQYQPHRRKQENRHKKANEMHPLHFIDRGGVGAKTNHLDCNHTASLFSTRADFSKVIQSLKETPLADERTCSTYQIRRATK